MRIVIACGGTGGHFYPGYALGKVLHERGHEVLFILRKNDPAAARLAAEDLPFLELDLGGLPRRPSLKLVPFALKLALSLRVAFNALRAFRPEVVVGMGGYLTFPIAAAARWIGIPCVLHESNAVLGLANRLCVGAAKALALGLPMKDRPKAVLAGTPIREELLSSQDAASARRRFGLDPARATLLVFGGSQGARALNRIAPGALALLDREHPGQVQILHLAGAREAEEVSSAYARSKLKAAVLPFLQEMHWAYAAADLVLCRAGASTLAELIALAKPAWLVPYPSAAESHQDANARVLKAVGAARMTLESALSPEGLAEGLKELLVTSYPQGLKTMSACYSALKLPAPGQSVKILADLVEAAP